MPDANGNFKGIAVPPVPWHEQTPDQREASVAAGTTGIAPQPDPDDIILEPECTCASCQCCYNQG